MENNVKESRHTGLKILLVILVVAVIALIGLFVYNKFIAKSTPKPKQNQQINIDKKDEPTVKYEFGQEVSFDILKEYEIYDGYTEDFSKFNVLSEDKEYLTLYMQKSWNKLSIDDVDLQNEYDGIKKSFSERGIDFGALGEVRGLNKDEITLLGCNFVTEECKNIPTWASYSLTGKIDGNYYTFPGTQAYQGTNIVIANEKDELIYFNPVIKILKTNIK